MCFLYLNLFGIVFGFSLFIYICYVYDIKDDDCTVFDSDTNIKGNPVSNTKHKYLKSSIENVIPRYQIVESKTPLQLYVKGVVTKKNKNNLPVFYIGDPLYNGLMVTGIGYEQSVLDLCSLILMRQKNSKFIHKGNYSTILISDQRNTRCIDELVVLIKLSTLLCNGSKGETRIILGHFAEGSNMFQAWNVLVSSGYVKSNNIVLKYDSISWIDGVIPIRKAISFSETMRDIIYEYADLNSVTGIKYYTSSQVREDEILTAYASDKYFNVTNITSGIHAAILKCIIPTIKINIKRLENDKLSYIKVCEFLSKFSFESK